VVKYFVSLSVAAMCIVSSAQAGHGLFGLHCHHGGHYGHACASPCGDACADACAGGPCAAAPAPCETQYVEKTVMVPEYVTETRTITCTEYQMQEQSREITVQKRVPVTE
jgi:hypothetical protein